MGERTEQTEKAPRGYPLIHPGELLKQEFLDPMGITVYRLAKDIGVDRMRVHEIVHGKRRVGTDTALRLSRYFDMSEAYWMNAQSHYDLETTKMKSGEKIKREVTPLAAGRGKENAGLPGWSFRGPSSGYLQYHRGRPF